jgi:hypothetical protein
MGGLVTILAAFFLSVLAWWLLTDSDGPGQDDVPPTAGT